MLGKVNGNSPSWLGNMVVVRSFGFGIADSDLQIRKMGEFSQAISPQVHY